MLKIIYLITLFTVGFSTLVIDGFRDISESVPKKNIEIAPVPSFLYSLHHEGREQQLEACSETCFNFEFRCNSFVVLETNLRTECLIFPTLGSVFKPSGESSIFVIAVYERESLPTAHELSQRFSNSPSNQQVMDMSEKYALPNKWEEVTEKILKTCSTALRKNLPVAVSITDWLRTGDLARSRLRRQSEFRDQLYRAFESWQAWPRDPQAPLQYADTVILTFLDIFFKSLDDIITTIYDPNEKTLIVEEPEKHLLIRSFGPGDYVLIFAQNNEGSSLNTFWTTYDKQRSELDHETLEMFKGAMKHFRHEVSSEELNRLRHFMFRRDSHTLSLKVIFDAITLMLTTRHDQTLNPSYEILVQDLVTAVVSSVIENEKTQPFRSNLLGATMRSIPDMRDINVITG